MAKALGRPKKAKEKPGEEKGEANGRSWTKERRKDRKSRWNKREVAPTGGEVVEVTAGSGGERGRKRRGRKGERGRRSVRKRRGGRGTSVGVGVDEARSPLRDALKEGAHLIGTQGTVEADTEGLRMED